MLKTKCPIIMRQLTMNEIQSLKGHSAQISFEDLINRVPGGAARLSIDENFSIIQASEGYYKLTGYSKAECVKASINNQASYFLIKEDIPMILEILEKAALEQKSCCIDYRIKRKDGTIIWNTAYTSCIEVIEGKRYVNAFFVDSTITKNAMLREQEINAERYKLISEQTRDILFDWDAITDCIYHSSAFAKNFGFQLPDNYRLSDLLNSNFIHPMDIHVLENSIQQLKNGARHAEAEYRARNIDGVYVWYCARATAIFDETRTLSRAIGTISNVNHYKKEAKHLMEKAQMDSLTGLLNRMSLQQQIENRISNSSNKLKYAFYLIDIDDFKLVNDSLGHHIGDEVLISISKRIKKIFRKNDIIGRLGGDEFVVFIENVPRIEIVKKKADLLNQIFYEPIKVKHLCYQVSGSIGIAIAPEHGSTFQELYEHADEALYVSKRSGKNCCSIYSPPEKL